MMYIMGTMANDNGKAMVGEQSGEKREKVGQGHPPKEYQFKPGNNANPNGRPKSRPIAAAIRELLDKDDGKSLLAIAKTAVDAAEDGDFRFSKEIMERIDGKVADKIEHSGRVDSLLTHEKFEDMDDDRKARFLRTAGVTDVLAPGDGADPGAMETGGV